jgi:TolA-binding protein
MLAACAGAAVRPAADAEELKELRSQLQAQSALLAQQQRRIEELEVKLAALAVKTQSAPAHLAHPDPRPPLKAVKTGGRLRKSDRLNPVEHAPRLPSNIELREPDEEALGRLAVDPVVAGELDADHIWADAVRKLNEGRHVEAEADLLAFAAAYPQHSAADNALYLAGLVREVRGDCAGALQIFESLPLKYPAGDAVPQAQLERGRCLRVLGRKQEAKAVLNQLTAEHPQSPESAHSRQLLQGL